MSNRKSSSLDSSMTGKLDKPTRLYFESYIQLLRNSVGSNMFRNLYVRTEEQGVFDALDDGYNSCAFYVSAVLVIFKKLSAIHGTVDSTKKDLFNSGWREIDEPKAGDVLVWEAMQFDDGLKEHIGFYLGKGKAISISWTKKTPIIHDKNFGDSKRKITHVFRLNQWD